MLPRLSGRAFMVMCGRTSRNPRPRMLVVRSVFYLGPTQRGSPGMARPPRSPGAVPSARRERFFMLPVLSIDVADLVRELVALEAWSQKTPEARPVPPDRRRAQSGETMTRQRLLPIGFVIVLLAGWSFSVSPRPAEAADISALLTRAGKIGRAHV